MDISKEYIEMCRKAVEIQELWWSKVEDWFTFGVGDGRYCKLYSSEYVNIKTTKKKNCLRIWLPRQDQLQEMIFDESDNLRCQCGMIYNFVDSELGTHWNTYGTMEQLWLAFVMHKKYNKKWNGNNWGKTK